MKVMKGALRLSLIAKYMLTLAAVAGLQLLISSFMAEAHHVWEGECTMTDTWEAGPENDVRMHIMCSDGEKYVLANNWVTVSYLKNPGPLTCWLSENGNFGCEVRPAPEKESEKGS